MSQTSEKIDLSAWFRKKEAAERIGCSEKHVEKLAHEGSLEMQMYRRPEGGPRVAVYHPRDVEKLASQRNPTGVHVTPEGIEPTAAHSNVIATAAQRMELRAVLAQNPLQLLRAVWGLSQTSETGIAVRHPVDMQAPSELRFVGYLSISEAMKFTGLPEKTIQKYAREGRIGKIGTKYRRKDLEGL